MSYPEIRVLCHAKWILKHAQTMRDHAEYRMDLRDFDLNSYIWWKKEEEFGHMLKTRTMEREKSPNRVKS